MKKIKEAISHPSSRIGWLLIPAIVLCCVVHDYWMIWRFPAPDKSSIEIRMTRTMCFGRCPAYNVTLYGNGLVVFEGLSYVAAIGLWKTRVDPVRVQELAGRIERAGFLDRRYEDTRTVFDSPEAVLSIQIGTRETTARHYAGTDYPAFQPLEDLEADIDNVAETEQWIGNGRANRAGYSAFLGILGALPLVVAVLITKGGRNAGRGLVGLALGLLAGGTLWLILRTLVVGSYYLDPLLLWDPVGILLYLVGVFICVRITVRASPERVGAGMA